MTLLPIWIYTQFGYIATISDTLMNTEIINSTAHIVFLIGEELKSRRFFSTLQKMGLDDSYYQPHLDEAILPQHWRGSFFRALINYSLSEDLNSFCEEEKLCGT
jgi:DNA-binding transcriptional regulator PaaX